MCKTDNADLPDRRWALWWGVRRSVRYHDRRVVWFDAIHRAGRFLTLLTSGAAVGTLLKTHAYWAMGFAAACAVFSALDLAFDVSAKARLHSSLKIKFVDLERAIIEIGWDSLTAGQIRSFNARRSEIERDEPPVLRCLDTICHNELCRADGIAERVPVRWWQRMLQHVWYGEPPELKPAHA